MQDCKPGDTPVAKGDKFSLNQCPKNDFEVKEIQKIPYALALGSLMYTQVCMHLDITYIIRMLGRYLSNLGMDIGKQPKMSRSIYKEQRIICSRIGDRIS